MVAYAIKERAYKLDPLCWESYSGKPKHLKQYMDSRRTASIAAAQSELMGEGWFFDEDGEFREPGYEAPPDVVQELRTALKELVAATDDIYKNSAVLEAWNIANAVLNKYPEA